MPVLRLTTVVVERLRAPPRGQVEYFDTHLPAFGLRVSYSGAKAWVVMTRLNGRLVRLTLGRYPELSLADARRKAREAVVRARDGQDPRAIVAQQQQRREGERRATFNSVGSNFLDTYVERKLRRKTRQEYQRILRGRDTEPWRSRPITTISKEDVKNLLRNVEQRGAPAAANRSLAYLSKFFNWCVEEDLISTSPTARVRPPCLCAPRDRILSDVELLCVWRALEGFPGPFAPLFKILMLTGQRRSEVGGMRWTELRELGGECAIWEIPAERTKNGKAHLVPLTSEVQAILIALRRTGPFVFTTTNTGPVSGFSKAKRQLDERAAHFQTRRGYLKAGRGRCMTSGGPWSRP